jgi:hypothetical protein
MNQQPFKVTEENAIDAPVKDIEWEGQDIQTDSVPMINDGSGKAVIVRVFDFMLPPLKDEEIPSDEELIRIHKTKLTAFLWRDELVPVQKFKCVLSNDKKSFKIFITCQAKAGSVILGTPELLQNVLQNK